MTVTVTLQFPNADAAAQALIRMVLAPVDGHVANATEVRERVTEQLEAAGIEPRPTETVADYAGKVVDGAKAAAPSSSDAVAPIPAPVEVPKPKRGRPKKTENAVVAGEADAGVKAGTVPAATAPAYPTVQQVIAKGREVYEKLGPQKGLVQCNALLARYGATRFSEILTARSPEFMKDADAAIGGTDFTAVVD